MIGGALLVSTLSLALSSGDIAAPAAITTAETPVRLAQATPRPPRAGAARRAAAETQDTPAQSVMDTSSIQELALGPSDWTYAPEPVGANKATRNNIPLTGGSGEFFAKVEKVLFGAPATTKAVVVHLNAPPGQPSEGRLERVDLATTKASEVWKLPAGLTVLAVSPQTSRVALQTSETGIGNKARLDIYDLAAGGTLKHVLSFSPHGDETWSKCDVTWAHFIDDDHLLTLSHGRRFDLWELSTKKGVYTMELGLIGDPAVSPDDKYVLLPSQQRVHVVEARTGAGAGTLPEHTSLMSGVCFRADGKQMVLARGEQVQVVDLTSNEIKGQYDLPATVMAREPNWVADNYLLLNNMHLLDLKRGLVVWQYQRRGLMNNSEFYGDRLWYVETTQTASKKGFRLVSAKIPSQQVIAAAAKMDPEKAFVIKPGVSVTLEVNLGDAERTRVASETLTKQLAANGMKVADGQPIKLIASVTPGESKEIRYRMFGQMSDMTGSFAEETLSVEFQVDGKKAWQTSSRVSAPMMITLKKDQTLDQIFEETKKNAYRFFESVTLPKRVQAPTEPLGAGMSALGAS